MQNRVLVIGGGISGCLSALNLAERGWQVTLADQGVLGGESSWAGGGILFPLLPWNYSEAVNQLALAGAAYYAGFCRQLHAATGIDPQYLKSGLRVINAPDLDGANFWCQQHDVVAEIQDGDLWLPEVAQVRNPRLMQALSVLLQKRKVDIIEHVALAPLQNQGQHITTWYGLNGQRFEADAFVLTAGAWSRNLLGNTRWIYRSSQCAVKCCCINLPPACCRICCIGMIFI